LFPIGILLGVLLAACATTDDGASGPGANEPSELFPETSGQEAELITNAPPSPLEPLDYFGPMVPTTVAQAYEAAGGYSEAQRWDEATQLGSFALRLAAQKEVTVLLLQVECLVTRAV